MGFDVHGLNPQLNTPLPQIMIQARDDDGWVKWENMTENDKTRYFDAKEKHDKENPGIYFRNNVWWWRPLWSFICSHCSDILSEEQMSLGCSNDGVKIYKTKAKQLAARIRKIDKQGLIQHYEDDWEKERKEASDFNKKVKATMDKFQKAMVLKYGEGIVPADYNEKDKKKWDEIYDTKIFSANYPFDRKNVLEFGVFCDESGGFEIW